MPTCCRAYLRFVRGVVDCEDVPLNISREMLQNNPVVGADPQGAHPRVLAELEGLANQASGRLRPVWEAFGAVLKEGLYEDLERREHAAGLARFRVDRCRLALAQGLRRRDCGRTREIYYLVGESLERLKASPQLEAARATRRRGAAARRSRRAFWTATPDRASTASR